MKYLYKYAKFPDNSSDLLSITNSAALYIHNILSEKGIEYPTMDTFYRNNYYRKDLTAMAGILKLYSYHIIWAINMCKKPVKEITLVDYGGGLGLMSLLAKTMGIGTVIYCDIDPKFVEAAHGIATVTGNIADKYIIGDVDALVEVMKKDKIDCLVSYDVLEHIYDLDEHINILCNSSCSPRVLFMSSGANMFRPVYVRSVLHTQRNLELQNFGKRLTIIKNCGPSLSKDEIVKIGKKTRMLKSNQIQEVVDKYIRTKKIEIPRLLGANAYDPYRSNTVDPETGWWAEHLFNPFYLAHVLRKQGYKSKILPGFHGGRKRYILNVFIRIACTVLALPIAPFYTVSAIRDDS